MISSDELLVIGQQLRAMRLERGESLEEVALKTRIRLKYLEAFEAGAFDSELSELQLKGFLRNYAVHLQLDLDAMRAAYQTAAKAQKRRGFKRKTAAIPPISTQPVPLNRNNAVDTPPYSTPKVEVPKRQSSELALVAAQTEEEANAGIAGMLRLIIMGGAALAVVALLGLAAFSLLQSGENPTQEDFINSPTPAEEFSAPLDGFGGETGNESLNTPPPLTIDDADASGETPPLAIDDADESGETPPLTIENAPSATPTTSAGGVIVRPPQPNMTGATEVRVVITANQRSWVRLTADDQVIYEGTLRPGTGTSAVGQRSVILRTANAGGLAVVVNNQTLGPLGAQGELFEQTFTLEGFSAPSIQNAPTIESGSAPEILPTIDPNAPAPLLPEDESQSEQPSGSNAPESVANSPPSATPPAIASNLPTPLPRPDSAMTATVTPTPSPTIIGTANPDTTASNPITNAPNIGSSTPAALAPAIQPTLSDLPLRMTRTPRP